MKNSAFRLLHPKFTSGYPTETMPACPNASTTIIYFGKITKLELKVASNCIRFSEIVSRYAPAENSDVNLII